MFARLGITMIEEGDIKPNILRLASKFMLAHPSLEKVPLKVCHILQTFSIKFCQIQSCVLS